MATVRRFEDLEVWQKARELVRKGYVASSDGAFARDFVLKDQLRRAAISIMANVAEGFERGGDREFLQFLAVAKGSCGEVRSHLCVGLDQKYLTDEQCREMTDAALEISRMIGGLMRHLRQSPLKGSKYK